MQIIEKLKNPRKDTVIDLGVGIYWLGIPQMATSELYVRGCYLEILAAREEYIKRDPYLQSGCDTFIIGTEGELAADPALQSNLHSLARDALRHVLK